jgi:hypothetical protein
MTGLSSDPVEAAAQNFKIAQISLEMPAATRLRMMVVVKGRLN